MIGGGLLTRLGLGLLFGRIKDVLGNVPPWLWKALAVVAALGALWWWHASTVSDAREEGRLAGRQAEAARWQAAFDTAHKAALDWRTAYMGTAETLNTERKARYAADLRAIAASADALRLRGPGAAAAPRCRPGAGLAAAASAGGPDGPGRPADAPLAPLPDEEPMAILPWAGVTRFAEQHDALRAEVLTWRAWYAEQQALRERAIKALPKPDFGP